MLVEPELDPARTQLFVVLLGQDVLVAMRGRRSSWCLRAGANRGRLLNSNNIVVVVIVVVARRILAWPSQFCRIDGDNGDGLEFGAAAAVVGRLRALEAEATAAG